VDKAPETILSAAALAAAAPAAVVRCQAAMLSRGPLAESATALAVELAQLLGCSQAAIALRDGGTAGAQALHIAGASPPVELDPRHAAAAALVAAMHEAIDQLRSVAWPPPAGFDAIVQAQRQLAGAGCACSIPLVDNGRIVGALSLVREAAPFTPQEIAVAEDVGLLAAPVLALKRRAELPAWRRVAAWVREALARPSRRRSAWLAAAVVIAAVLAVPLPWRVSAPARLEGEVQRAVTAATDGFLQQVNVRPGDRVKAGQVLAELASQDLELERRRREGELRQHESAYLAAQARYDRTQMVAAQAKAAEAQAMLTLAETQLQRARAVAPFDGIVIKGDLSQNLGAPVQRGEVLMVLAPDERYRLIVEVDESDIAAVKPGQRGEVALSSQPDAHLPFTVTRIVPVATAGEGRNYFEVEARLDGASGPLRPGLSGVAKVGAGSRPLAVLLTHRAWNWLRLAVWSVAP
jgi:RND family efflux transporter MFP subunit